MNIFVDYTQPLSEMIRACGFGFNNWDITEKHFPVNRHQNTEKEMKVFSTEELVGETRIVTSEEVEKALDKLGYRTAELQEGLAYARANPDEQGKYPIVILGSIWRPRSGDCRVPYFWYGNGRELGLNWCGNKWRSADRFLAVRK